MAKKRDEDDLPECFETMVSYSDPTHIHTCGGSHDAGKSHKCDQPRCGKFFWKKGDLV